MSSPLPPPSILLVYLPTHRVLICTYLRCQHALAPDSILRHLKEIHRLRRAARKPFMDYVSILTKSNTLATPEEVIASSPGGVQGKRGFPVSLLPLLEGFECQVGGVSERDGNPVTESQMCSIASRDLLSATDKNVLKPCGYLCVSEKRMKMHWGANHGITKGECKRVRLQTWYKGNMLRYFTDGKSIEEVKDNSVEVNKCGSISDSDPALLHHFTTSTYLTLATDKPTSHLWRVTIPLLAHGHPFLMHGILAISALHLSHQRHQPHLVIAATQHQSQALPDFAAAIAVPTKENCHAVFVFSHLLTIYSSASASHDERLFIVDTRDAEVAVLPQWLHFLRSGCSTLCDVWDFIEEGPVGALAETWEVHFTPERRYEADIAGYFSGMIPSENITNDSWTEEETAIYRNAAAELCWAFSFSKARSGDFSHWDALRAWPIRVDLAFLGLLGRGHPGALILLAHFCILLKQVDRQWYFTGRAHTLLDAVLSRLEARWLDCVRWPVDAVRGKGDSCQYSAGEEMLTQDGVIGIEV